jgi:hypothetical protein
MDFRIPALLLSGPLMVASAGQDIREGLSPLMRQLPGAASPL